MRCSLGKLFLLGLVLLGSLPVPARKPCSLRVESMPFLPERRSLTLRSGYVFSGTVKSVERVAPRTKDGVAVMRISFHVNQGLRGTRTGQMLVIREVGGVVAGWRPLSSWRARDAVSLSAEQAGADQPGRRRIWTVSCGSEGTGHRRLRQTWPRTDALTRTCSHGPARVLPYAAPLRGGVTLDSDQATSREPLYSR